MGRLHACLFDQRLPAAISCHYVIRREYSITCFKSIPSTTHDLRKRNSFGVADKSSSPLLFHRSVTLRE